jgi:cytochrome c
MPSSIKCAFAAWLAVLAAAGTARAATPESLFVTAGCSACHAANKKIVGPSFHDIAGRYKADATAPATLAAKVRSGGKGVWGPMAMPPTDAKKISDADLDAVIAWILKQ